MAEIQPSLTTYPAMSPIFNDLNLPGPKRSPSGLLEEDFAEAAVLQPSSSASPARNGDDPLETMRKIFMGGQMDDFRQQVASLERQVAQLRDSLNQKIRDLEHSFREDITRVTKAAADSLQAQNETLSQEIEQTRANLVTSVDDRFRKLSAAAVPRTHLAEILRDLSSRLQPASAS